MVGQMLIGVWTPRCWQVARLLFKGTSVDSNDSFKFRNHWFSSNSFILNLELSLYMQTVLQDNDRAKKLRKLFNCMVKCKERIRCRIRSGTCWALDGRNSMNSLHPLKHNQRTSSSALNNWPQSQLPDVFQISSKMLVEHCSKTFFGDCDPLAFANNLQSY